MMRVASVGALGILGAVACGYSFRTDAPPQSLREIAVRPFENQTLEPGVEVAFTESLRFQLLRSRATRLRPEARAQAVFSGRVLKFGVSPIAFPGSATGVRVGAYRASATVEVELVRRDGSVVFRRGPISGEAEYLTGPSVLGTEANKNRAVRQIAFEIMRDVREALMRPL